MLFYGISAGRDTVWGHLSQFPPADINSHSNELKRKLGQLAVRITWLTCGCSTCYSTHRLFNPSALFLHSSSGCWRVSWQLSQKGWELFFPLSWLILLLQLSPAHFYLQHHEPPPPPSVSGASLSFHASLYGSLWILLTVNYLPVCQTVVPRIWEVLEVFAALKMSTLLKQKESAGTPKMMDWNRVQISQQFGVQLLA